MIFSYVRTHPLYNKLKVRARTKAFLVSMEKVLGNRVERFAVRKNMNCSIVTLDTRSPVLGLIRKQLDVELLVSRVHTSTARQVVYGDELNLPLSR